MNNIEIKLTHARTAVALVAFALLAAGCVGKKEGAAGYATPEAAVAALVAALEKDDTAAIAKLLGPGTEDLLSSGDPVADKTDRAEFLAKYKAKNSLAVDGDRMMLTVGDNEWPMPIPLVQRDGKWVWDGAAGVDEMIYRRVGENELGAIDVMYGYVNAQNAYASEGRDGDPAGIYALKLISDQGMHNGLYWPTAEGETPSPAGPFVAAAAGEGYASAGRTPYHGYYYRMLYAQGPNANGGEREYFKDGVLTEGFAGIAWPADYGASGVMTFIVNPDGVVFQKDLGEDTATAVETIQKFDPDSTWTAIVPPNVSAEAPASSEVPPGS
ncbi:MAG: DUF2950 domain-containing protein [Steroidobacteraceae bacterium]